jgi:DNA-binding NarL/FixJ family response regulator
MSEPYHIVLADDHQFFREVVKQDLKGHPGLTVVGEACDGCELLDLLKTVTPDLIILDISMPNLPGLEAAVEIRRLYPHIKILVLTMHKSGEYLRQALNTGVQGYLLKEHAFDDLATAIKTVRQGGTYISPLMAAEFSHFLPFPEPKIGEPKNPSKFLPPPHSTPRKTI